MDGDDGVGAIVFAAKHLLRLGGLDLGLKLVERAGQVGPDVFAAVRPLDEHADVVGAPLEGAAECEVVLDAAATLHYLLRAGLISPETRFADLLLDFGELLVEACVLKDTSAVPPRAGSTRRTA